MLSLFRVLAGILYLHFMNRTGIRLSLILGVITVLLITGVQIYFVHNAFNQEDRQLNQTIEVALRSVTEKMTQLNQSDLPFTNPVHRIKPDYYVANVEGFIDTNMLEHFLIAEFQRQGLELDFEFGIYDCQSDDFIYGKYVSFGKGQKTNSLDYSFTKYSEYLYYFGIYFPGRTRFILNNLGVWYFFSLVLIFVLAFFIYSQIIMLKQRRLAEIQKDFINNLTHELRTPLSSVLMSAEVIASQDILQEPERLKTYGKIIQNQTRHLISQIDRILGLSDQSLKRNFHPEEIQLSQLVEEVAQDVQEKIRQLDGEFQVEMPTETITVWGDPVLIRQMLNNLLDNAIKYARNVPKVSLSLVKNGKKGQLIISDQGIGIPKSCQKRIYNRFFRVPKGNVHNVKGYGLGLYQVKQVVRLHRWKIQLESTPDQGSEFVLTFNSI